MQGKRFSIPFLLLLCWISLGTVYAQSDIRQTVRGNVKDKESKSGIAGATLRLYKDSSLVSGANSDEKGNYRIPDVPIGKYTLKVNYTGYGAVIQPNVMVNSAREVILNIELESSARNVQEVIVTATAHPGEVKNDMATVSARTFSVEEANRYAGSRDDPARMASNYAGVQGADDSRNDIVIRGNSPLGVLWRLEGVDIPNPNHFAVSGSTGGPVSMLNTKMLENSDFFTGAFPAEYGNSVAGVFDLRMRNGNNEKHEFTAQLGFLGTELTGEGPLSKTSGASYLVNYRYSTLQLFQFMHIKIGTSAVPSYQDGSFKLNFPLKGGGNLSFFGMGGASQINIKVSSYTSPAQDLYGDSNRDQFFGSATGFAGMAYSKSFNASTFFKVTLGASIADSYAKHELVYRSPSYALDSVIPKMGYRFTEMKYSLNFFVNRKFGTHTTLKAGMTNDLYTFNMLDSNYNENTYRFVQRWNYTGVTMLLQPYAQIKYKPSDDLVTTFGLHGQYLTLNGSESVDPCAGAKYTINDKQSLSFGLGLHSQMMPTYVYFYHQQDAAGNYVYNPDGSYYLHNLNVGFMHSAQAVLGYDYYIKKGTHLRLETYYQHLYDVPIEKKASAFSILNQGVGFSRFFPDTLVNKGTGENYGLELTLEKFFSKSFFFMVTGSVFNSTYVGSDGVTRNTAFNGIYAVNLLAGKEFRLTEKSKLSLGMKVTMAGGHRFTPIDTAATRISSDVQYIDSKTNSLQLKDYFRLDMKINYVLNTKKLTHEIGLDLVNLLNTKNVLAQTYSRDLVGKVANPVVDTYQLGFLPLFYYRVDF